MKVGKKPVAVLIMMFKMRGAWGRIYYSWMKKKMGGERGGEGLPILKITKPKPMLTALRPGWNSRNWNEVLTRKWKKNIMNELKNEQHYQKQIQRKIWKMKALLLSYQFMLSKYESSFWLKWNGYETR